MKFNWFNHSKPQIKEMSFLSQVAVVCVALTINFTDGFSVASSSRSSSRGVGSLLATATQAPKTTAWSPTSWRSYPIKQPPNYPDEVRISVWYRVMSEILQYQKLSDSYVNSATFYNLGKNSWRCEQTFQMRASGVRWRSPHFARGISKSVFRTRIFTYGWWLCWGVQWI